MGKYDKALTDDEARDSSVYLFFIANELAEANRLKRFELGLRVEDSEISELEDKA